MKRVRVFTLFALYTFFILWLIAATLNHQAPIGTGVPEGAYKVHSFLPLGTTCVSSDEKGSLSSVFLPEPWWDFGILIPVGVAILVLEIYPKSRHRKLQNENSKDRSAAISDSDMHHDHDRSYPDSSSSADRTGSR
jgi:hypothetical protein